VRELSQYAAAAAAKTGEEGWEPTLRTHGVGRKGERDRRLRSVYAKRACSLIKVISDLLSGVQSGDDDAARVRSSVLKLLVINLAAI